MTGVRVRPPRALPAPLTDDDQLIWLRVQLRARVVPFQFRARAADRSDADLMWLREDAKATTTQAWEDWATHRREWFPARWGLA